ncbi:MAG: metallophosphoesterase [Bacillota bacterium]|nr:metallophosphoesterase [Bacillota bacterium]
MSIFAIADLHLSLAPDVDKPMDIYGPRWFNHVERLEKNWREMITDDDTVIVAGDISWALKLEDAKYDLDWVASLPGHKVIYKGNHDLWWNGITKLNKMYDTITFVQNDCFVAEDFVLCGTRGWLTPDNDEFKEPDEKVYRRELMRMQSALEAGKKYIAQSGADAEMLGILHFPPVSKTASFSGFQQLFEDYGIKRVLYGHIHSEDAFKNAIKGVHHNVKYDCISLDYLNCKPILIERSPK